MIGSVVLVAVLTANPTLDPRFSGVVVRDGENKTSRRAAAISEFRRAWPCPVTGKTSGACPGWSVDHVIPLDCGGVDAVLNMQWLPTEIKSAKGPHSKDHFERKVYGGHKLSAGCP